VVAAIFFFDLAQEQGQGAVEDHCRIAVADLTAEEVLDVPQPVVGLLRYRELDPIALRRERRDDRSLDRRWLGDSWTGGFVVALLRERQHRRYRTRGRHRGRKLPDRRRHVRLWIEAGHDQLDLADAAVPGLRKDGDVVLGRQDRSQ
jgi:hypothetical protein